MDALDGAWHRHEVRTAPRRHEITTMALAWLVAASTACKQAEPPPPGSEVLGKARALSAQMCACADRACARPVRVSWSELTHELSGVTFTEDQVEGLMIEDQRFVRCLERFAEPGSPPAGSATEPSPTREPPPAPTSSSEPPPPTPPT